MTTRDYPSTELTVHWNNEICIHSAVCAKTLPGVFHPREKPWITVDGATDEEIAAMIDTCPSGALSYTWHKDSPAGEAEHGGQA